jgi:hypothetical protein
VDSDLRTVGRRPDLDEVFGLDAKRFDEYFQTVRRHGGGQEDDLYLHLAELFGENFPFVGAIRMAIADVVKFVDKDFAELLPQGGHQQTAEDGLAAAKKVEG